MTKQEKHTDLVPLEVRSSAFVETSNYFKSHYGVNVDEQAAKSGVARNRLVKIGLSVKP